MADQLKIITTIDELHQSRDQWNALAGHHPFMNWEWMTSWWETFGNNRELRVLVGIGSDGRWKAMAPFFMEKKSLGSNQLQLISSGKACADYSGLLAKAESGEWFAQQVARWLNNEHPHLICSDHFDLVDLEGLYSSCDLTQLFCAELVAKGFSGHSTSLENCWEAKLCPTWQEFNGQLSKSFRRKTKKAVQRLDNPTTKVVVIQSNDGFEKCWSDFVKLHQSRREMLGQPGCFAEVEFENFLKKAVWRLLERNAAALLLVYVDNLPFAAGLLMTNETHAYMYQSGVDANRIKMEPGHVLNTAMIQFAIDSGKTHFDFLRGDEPYKARWNAIARPLVRMRFVPDEFVAKLRHKIWLTARSIKQWASGAVNANSNE